MNNDNAQNKDTLMLAVVNSIDNFCIRERITNLKKFMKANLSLQLQRTFFLYQIC